MKRYALAVAFAALLSVATVGSALANHGATTTSAPVPPHGSIWFGCGLKQYEIPIAVISANHYYGGGPDQFLKVVVPVPVHGAVGFGGGIGH